MSWVQEFKEFAFKGNVIDLAIAVVIGGAFTKIVSALVQDIITPAVLNPVMKASKISKLENLTIKGTDIRYGSFLSALITFIIIALILFFMVKAINQIKPSPKDLLSMTNETKFTP